MILQNHKTFSRGDEGFDAALEELQKKYFHNGGDEDAEVIINWNKREAKEDGVVCIFAANSVISSAIKRCRQGLERVDILPEGANLYFNTKFVRPLHTVLKVAK
jgi:hypothetical protein